MEIVSTININIVNSIILSLELFVLQDFDKLVFDMTFFELCFFYIFSELLYFVWSIKLAWRDGAGGW